ncbi:MAG: ethanolamine ammonia-lyase subunit EutC, partial [Anaerolineaceae bacterium]|nr:ethanolamine ammonia-lyase subunit EutC [Anaerolineaceae bacterium]
IGERPGLGRAESMSVYMGYRPQTGYTDAERDVICNVFDGGGTNPLEAGAYAVQMAQKMLKHQSSGVKLKLKEGA